MAIKEGNLNRYLKYAVGEILLVVIGILIALQINNWNETRKTRSTQNELLQKLSYDLDADMDNLGRLDSMYEKWGDQVDHILEFSLNGSANPISSPDEYLVGSGNLYYINVKQTTFNEMISRGVFYSLPDDDLSSSISEYYEFVNSVVDKRNRDNQDFYNYLLRIGHIEVFNRILRLAEQRNLDNLDWTWLKDPSTKEYKEFETRVLWFKGAIAHNQSVIKELMGKAMDLKNEIESY